MNKKTRLFLCLSLVVCSLLFTVKVDAAVVKKEYTRGGPNIKTSSFGIGGNTHTIYNKKVGGKVAYCPELKSFGPPNNVQVSRMDTMDNASYKKSTHKCSIDNYVAGQIITRFKEKYTGQKQYMYITQALNEYYGRYAGYKLTNARVKVPDEIIDVVNKSRQAVDNYDIKQGSCKVSLKAIKIEGSKVLTQDKTTTNSYKSGDITISGLQTSKVGGDTKYTDSTKPEYTFTISKGVSGSTVTLCPKSGGECKASGSITNGTYYLKVTNGGSKDNITLKITGSNTSKYPSAYRWYYKKDHQRFVTYIPTVTVTRSVNNSKPFTYEKPSENPEYSAGIEKVDDTGEKLAGASLELFTADYDEETGNISNIKQLCNVDASKNETSCIKTGIQKNNQDLLYNENRYICYKETTTPKGYKKISTSCRKISFTNNDYYYRLKFENNTKEEISGTEYENSQKYAASSAGESDLKYKYIINGTTTYESVPTKYKYTYSDGSVEYKDEYIGNVNINGEGSGDGGSGETNPVTVVSIEPVEPTATVCYNTEAGEGKLDYCSGEYQYNKMTFESGSVDITVGNSLNSVNISKKTITGDNEVPGATLSIFKADSSGKCSTNLATSRGFSYVPYTAPESNNSGNNDGEGDNTSGGDESTPAGNSDDEGEDETDTEEAEEDIASSGLRWESSVTPATIYGLEAGNYCLQEELPPNGYKVSPTVVKFSMDESGKVTATSKDYYDEETNTLIIRDDYTKISISKTDIATTKELPGAELKICSATQDEQGKYIPVMGETEEETECHPVSLVDGTEATWTSGTTPHDVVGLAAGTYYLIETTAPNGYSVAESVLFVLKEDGTLTDINGKSLADNKLVMYDAHIKVPNTAANISFYIVLIALFLFLLAAYGTYCVYKDKEMFPFIKKIKKKSNKK